MYEDFLETILTYIKALNAADAELDNRAGGPSGDIAILGDIEVIFMGEVVGHLVDELGSAWSYREVSPEPPPEPSKPNPDTIIKTPVNPADMLRVDL